MRQRRTALNRKGNRSVSTGDSILREVWKEESMTDFEKGRFDIFELITSAYHGKQYYFLEDEENSLVYSRESHRVMPMESAVIEFLKHMDWSCS